MIENHFPAPDREFVDNLQNQPKNVERSRSRSPSPKKRKNRNLRAKVLKSLSSGLSDSQDDPPKAKRPRIIYSSDSDSEQEDQHMDDSDDGSHSDDKDFASEYFFSGFLVSKKSSNHSSFHLKKIYPI